MDKYSFLLSVYYKEKPEYLKQSIESMINQTLTPDEIVIVCDGQLTNELDKILEEYHKMLPNLIKIYRLDKNQGLGKALAYGIGLCQNEIVARMDSDDISHLTRMKKTMDLFEIDPNLELVGTNCIEFMDSIDNPVSSRIMPEKHNEIIKYSKSRCPFVHPSVTFKKTAVINAGNYRDRYLVEDYDLWVRMLQLNTKSYNIQENLTFMRINEFFYKRRGGFKYMKSIVGFKKSMYKMGYISYFQYIKTSIPTIIVSFMPNFFRTFIYKKLLRK